MAEAAFGSAEGQRRPGNTSVTEMAGVHAWTAVGCSTVAAESAEEAGRAGNAVVVALVAGD